MTHPHEGLQERALREALEKYDKTVKDCPANRMHLGDKLCPTCNAGHDEGCRKEIMAAGDVVRAARSSLATLLQQAATDEGEEPCPVCSCEARGQGGYLQCECPALSTPTAQPPAAETRLMGEQRDVTAKIIAAGYSGDPWWWKEAFDDDQDETAVRLPDDDRKIADDVIAALTQPEPTAQQAADEGDALQSIRRVLAGIEGNPKGDALDREAASVAMKLIDAIGKAG